MGKIKNGDTIKVHYTGKLDDGSVFDTSEGREPLQFEVGEGQVIEGFEEAVVGMNKGESKTIKIASDKGYGDCREDMFLKVDRGQIPPEIPLEVGLQLQVTGPGGQPAIVTVKEISDKSITLDANHPLAGKELTFEIEIVEIA